MSTTDQALVIELAATYTPEQLDDLFAEIAAHQSLTTELAGDVATLA